MSVAEHADLLAEWLHEKRRAGILCPSRMVPPAAKALCLTEEEVKEARAYLRKVGRFKQKHFQAVATIDGQVFTGERDLTPVDRIKDLLRKRFKCAVIDPRTIKFPKDVATGIPDCLYIGSRKVAWNEAVSFVADCLDGPVQDYFQSA